MSRAPDDAPAAGVWATSKKLMRPSYVLDVESPGHSFDVVETRPPCIELMQIIRAPREQVFQAWTDYETWPTWDHVVFSRVRVAERSGNTAVLDADIRFMGLKMPRTEKHVLTPPEKVEVEGGVRGIRNTTAWTFDVVPEGTRLTAVLDVQLSGPLNLLGPLVRRQGTIATREWLSAFAKHVETT